MKRELVFVVFVVGSVFTTYKGVFVLGRNCSSISKMGGRCAIEDCFERGAVDMVGLIVLILGGLGKMGW